MRISTSLYKLLLSDLLKKVLSSKTGLSGIVLFLRREQATAIWYLFKFMPFSLMIITLYKVNLLFSGRARRPTGSNILLSMVRCLHLVAQSV